MYYKFLSQPTGKIVVFAVGCPVNLSLALTNNLNLSKKL